MLRYAKRFLDGIRERTLEGAVFRSLKKICVEADLFLCLGLPHLRSPAKGALPSWRPQLAGLG